MQNLDLKQEVTEITSDGDVQRSENWPAITVQICTCNGRTLLLKRCLESVLTQTFEEFDVVLVSDGVPDRDTIVLCEEYQHKLEDRGVDFYFVWLDEPTGYYTIPRNYALQYCAGDYIAHLDDDNEWYPYTLQTYLDAIEEGNEWPDFVYGRRLYICDEGAPKESNGTPLMEGESPLVPFTTEAVMGLAVSPMYNFVDSSEFMISKGALYMKLAIQGMVWDENKRRFGDWDLITKGVWPDFMVNWKGKAIDKVVQKYHWHATNVSTSRSAYELPRAEKINE